MTHYRAPSFELKLRHFIYDVRESETPMSKDSLKEAMGALVKQFIAELSVTADFEHNDEILDFILATENFHELVKSKVDDYIVRKHIRDIMKCYIQAVGDLKKISIKDETQFGVLLSAIGLYIGLSTKRESDSSKISPDGNVVVLSLLTLAIVAILLLRPTK